VTDLVRISDIVGEYGVLPLYRLLGYFSVLGLLRVHTMLGDFTLALKSMENVELNQKVFTSILAHPGGSLLTLINHAIVFAHPSDRMPCLDLLLRWVLLHDAQAVHRRNAHVRVDPEPHTAHAAIPHTELSIRPNQQNCRQDVRPVRDLQRLVSQSVGRQYLEHRQGAIRRTGYQDVKGRGRYSGVRGTVHVRLPQVRFGEPTTVRRCGGVNRLPRGLSHRPCSATFERFYCRREGSTSCSDPSELLEAVHFVGNQQACRVLGHR